MPRIVSVWLESWAITRFLRHSPAGGAPDPGRPLVLVADGPGGPRLTALDPRAQALGLGVGGSLADARAKVGPGLQVRPADPGADRAALRALSLWATRYGPAVAPFGAPEGEDGFFLDVAGAAHLVGGEAALLADLSRRLAGFGLAPRLALANGPGSAYALARHGRDGTILTPGAERAALVEHPLARLPLAALRLDPALRLQLRRLGLRRVGQVAGMPRAPLARRFGPDLVRRVEEALCLRPEPLAPVRPAPVHEAVRRFLDPVTRQPTVVATARDLMRAIKPALVASDVGARRLRLTLYRVDGAVFPLAFGLAEPTREPAHLARLVTLRLERPDARVEAGFGFETIRLEALAVGRLSAVQRGLGGADTPASLAGRLADTLHQRLGRRAARLGAVASHLPERASVLRPLGAEEAAPWPARGVPVRPLLRFPSPEPADDVVALVPDGPPQRFRWRRRLHRVAHAQGPERIAGEWWREPGAAARDYYVVEDEAGRRLWLYREGVWDGAAPVRWYVHGLFA